MAQPRTDLMQERGVLFLPTGREVVMGVRTESPIRRLPESWLFAVFATAGLASVGFVIGAAVAWGVAGFWVSTSVMSTTYWTMRCLIEAERRGYVDREWLE